MATSLALGGVDQRGEARQEVHYRTRGIGPDERPLSLVIVNLSARGLMVRCPTSFGVDERVRVTLPVAGTVAARVRWSLGGRMGCELERAIALADYDAVLAAMAGKS